MRFLKLLTAIYLGINYLVILALLDILSVPYEPQLKRRSASGEYKHGVWGTLQLQLTPESILQAWGPQSWISVRLPWPSHLSPQSQDESSSALTNHRIVFVTLLNLKRAAFQRPQNYWAVSTVTFRNIRYIAWGCWGLVCFRFCCYCWFSSQREVINNFLNFKYLSIAGLQTTTQLCNWLGSRGPLTTNIRLGSLPCLSPLKRAI